MHSLTNLSTRRRCNFILINEYDRVIDSWFTYLLSTISDTNLLSIINKAIVITTVFEQFQTLIFFIFYILAFLGYQLIALT